MITQTPSGRGKVLDIDTEELLKKWIELHTLSKVVAWTATQGYINPETGKPVTKQGISQKIWRWISEHPHMTYTKYIKPMYDSQGTEFTLEEWWTLLNRRAKSVHTKAGYKSWKEKNYQTLSDFGII